MPISVGGSNCWSLLALALIASAVLSADAGPVRLKRTQTGTPNSGVPHLYRSQNDYGLPCSQADVALKEVNNTIKMIRRLKNCTFLPPEIMDSPYAGQLEVLLSGEHGVTSVEFMEQLELFRMLMLEVSKNRLLQGRTLRRLVEKVRDLQRNLTTHCVANASASGHCQQPDQVTRTIGNIRFINDDTSLEAGACLLDMMQTSLSSAKLQLCSQRTRRGSDRGRKGRQQGKTKKNKGKKDEKADGLTTEAPDVDDEGNHAAPRAENKAKNRQGLKRSNKKGNNSRRGEGKKKQQKGKKGGNQKARELQ